MGGGLVMSPGDRLAVDAGVHRIVKPAAAQAKTAPRTSPTPTPSPTKAAGGAGSLPDTGTELGGLLTAGAMLVGGGAALTMLARRRRGQA
jgi:LPXTG-motif cell wall-anchored protein